MNCLEDNMGRNANDRFHFEASRFFQVTLHSGPRSGWYYQAREGTFGPFIDRGQAERDLLRLIDKNPSLRLEIYRRLGLEANKL